MNDKNEILDKFGKILIQQVFDNQVKFILNDLKELSKTKEYANLFKTMTEVQKNELVLYTSEILKGTLFDFLKIFEENPQYKLIYEENKGHQINLLEISEMLKAEPIIENGWLKRFSELFKD
jgi:hypothetical protein